MKIEKTTRFNLGQTVLRFNTTTMKLEEFTIESISVSVRDREPDNSDVIYFDSNYKGESESKLFGSKEEFVNQL